MDERVSSIIKEYIEHCFDMVQDNIGKDSDDARFTPSAIAIAEEGGNDYVTFLPWNTDEEKVLMLQELGALCYQRNLLKVALVNDAVMKFYDEKPDSQTQFPLSYPPSMRDDCLIFLYIDFKDPHNNLFKAYKYKISEGKVLRGDEINFNKDVQKMDSLLISSITFGFTRAAMLDLYQKKEIVDKSFNRETGNMLFKEILEKYPGAAAGMEVRISSQL